MVFVCKGVDANSFGSKPAEKLSGGEQMGNVEGCYLPQSLRKCNEVEVVLKDQDL